jgi:hypothetical protein
MEGFAALPQRQRRRERKRELPAEEGGGEEEREERAGVLAGEAGGEGGEDVEEPEVKRAMVEVAKSSRGKPPSAAEFAALQEEERLAAEAIAGEFQYECMWGWGGVREWGWGGEGERRRECLVQIWTTLRTSRSTPVGVERYWWSGKGGRREGEGEWVLACRGRDV